MAMGVAYFEHVADRGAEGVVDETEIEVAASLDERGYRGVVFGQR